MSYKYKIVTIMPLILCFFLISNCAFIKTTDKYNESRNKQELITKKEIQSWFFKDSIYGINLNMAYDFLKKKNSHSVVVAVIDTELDIDHKDLKNQIWGNKDEIPNNNIDDDNNGYIDDIHGWNFVGSKKKGKIPYGHFEYVRIIKKYDSLFKNIVSINEVSKDKWKEFKLYQKAYLEYYKELDATQKSLEDYITAEERYASAINIVKKYIKNIEEPYDPLMLDSLKKTLVDNKEMKTLQYLINYKKYDVNLRYIKNKQKLLSRIINYKLNFEFNERYLTNDDSDDLNDFPYGNNNVQGTKKISHSTKVTSVIAASRNDTLMQGINNNVKIMPLSISVAGSEHDKDIALAILYAVDNGAKIINMSIGKNFSLHPEWVYDALKYAEKRNVLVVTSSGNDGFNLDKIVNYPNDAIDGHEFINNFIKVGNTSFRLDSTLVDDSSNYGKREVDIFAPGTKITCLNRWRVTEDTGTSLSCAVVSGVASLLFSYYPNLTAAEVKEIILQSGTSIDLMVLKPYPNGEKRDTKKVPFSSLSKSGKIVNAYNALLMAEEVSKKKKKRKRK